MYRGTRSRKFRRERKAECKNVLLPLFRIPNSTLHTSPALRLHRPLAEGDAMKCEVCGNDYDKAFTVELGGKKHTFDSFECAIHALAPTCDHCGCHVVGHGVEQDGSIYCCAHCAHEAGAMELKDRHEGN